MSKRLQVLVDEDEAERFRRLARRQHISLGEWVRRALAQAANSRRGPRPEERLAALDRALSCGHPTSDTETMLADIERGRGLR